MSRESIVPAEVLSVDSGYARGTTENPTYEAVCTGIEPKLLKIGLDGAPRR